MRLRLKLTVRNASALRLREELQLTQQQVADACDVPLSRLQAIEQVSVRMDDYASERNDKWIRYIERVASFYGVSVDTLCPPESFNLKMPKFMSIETEMSAVQLRSDPMMLLENKTQELESNDIRDACLEWIKSLSPKCATVVRMYFGFDGHDYSIHEIGKNLGVTDSRVHKLLGEAIRKGRGVVTKSSIRLLMAARDLGSTYAGEQYVESMKFIHSDRTIRTT